MAGKKGSTKKVVDKEFLDENPELIENGLEVGDEVEIDEEEVEEKSVSKKGMKYEIWDTKTGYIRTYDDKTVAQGFAGKVATREVREVKA